MATFTNQATLSYNNNVKNSNVATGELLAVLTATKTAVMDDYVANDDVTFIISIVNSGPTAYTGLKITDDLGAYPFGLGKIYPLAYQTGSIRYYLNGTLQAVAPTVVAGPPLEISGVSVPAGGNALIVFEANVTKFAPLAVADRIDTEAVITGGGLSDPLSAKATITTEDVPNLTISKTVSPTTVTENGELTYTFILLNSGNTAAVAADHVVLTDTFDPILDPIAVRFNGTLWADPANYDYDNTTGEFATVDGQITVPAATFTQDPANGNWIVNPGVSTLTITGTV
ncbi:MAG: conserved repeat domain [Evtepia sp.]|jgi:uncharacterized repeat protein (TIGR01451 family)|nr:conserved repeat domain [Evtepia sp.]